VKYVLEGSVRKAGNRIRVTAQLIDGNAGKHVWASRYDREYEDVFAVQDEIAETIVGAVEPELGKAERERAKAKRLFRRAAELDPGLGAAFSGLAEAYYFSLVYGHSDSSEQDRDEALVAARTAVELDSEDACAHCTLGRVHYARMEHEQAISELETALDLNPSLAWGHYGVGAALVFSGRAQQAIQHLETAIRLSPRDPNMGSFLVRMADSHLFIRNYEEAIQWTKKALRQPNFQWSRYAVLVSALGHLGRLEEAQRTLEQLRTRRADFSTDFVRSTHLIADVDYMQHYIEGLQKAGLP
jgi:tetratricopeptide (TPR) repeat protein